MILIYICEDDPIYLEKIKKCVTDYVTMEALAMSVVCSSTRPDDILKHLEQADKTAGLYFLDLNLNCDINGIQLAEKIRAYDPLGCIVFITSDGHSYKLTFEYKVEALDYIVKGDFEMNRRICECIQKAHARLIAPSPVQDNFVFKLARDTTWLKGAFKLAQDSLVSVNSNDIVYFETSPESKRVVVVYTTDGRQEFRGSLTKVEGKMDKKRFYRCQRNLIINLARVTAVDTTQLKIVFDNGLCVDIAAKQASKLMRHVEESHAGR